MNIFERASRAKLLIPTSLVGDISVDSLWDLPLTAKSDRQVDLDKLARAASRDVKNYEEESFVKVTPDPRKVTAELRLEILKHVIASKLADLKSAETRAATAETRQKLLAALAEKKDKKLGDLSEEELNAQIKALDDAA